MAKTTLKKCFCLNNELFFSLTYRLEPGIMIVVDSWLRQKNLICQEREKKDCLKYQRSAVRIAISAKFYQPTVHLNRNDENKEKMAHLFFKKRGQRGLFEPKTYQALLHELPRLPGGFIEPRRGIHVPVRFKPTTSELQRVPENYST